MKAWLPTRDNWPWFVGGLAVAGLPLLGDDYVLSLMVVGGIYAILCIGLNLFMGQTGQISFGHNAFAAFGCYGTAILTTEYGWPPLAALFASAVLAMAAAGLIGLPTLRLKGHYLAMATLALGLIVYQLAVQLKSITLGFLGISGIPTLGIGPFKLDSDVEYYYAIWLAVALAVWISARIIDSRVGRALGAIAGNEDAARALGVDVSRYKLLAFAISAAYASVGGSLLAHYVTFVSPEVIGLPMTTLLFTMIFVGGIGTNSGPILGAVLISILPSLLSRFESYRQLVYGGMLLVVILFVPRGLHSLGQLRRIFGGVKR
jgi:branched-chain amino acid transport system permease protein